MNLITLVQNLMNSINLPYRYKHSYKLELTISLISYIWLFQRTNYIYGKANKCFLKIEKLLNILQCNQSYEEEFEINRNNCEIKPDMRINEMSGDDTLDLIKQHIDYEVWRTTNMLYLIETKAVYHLQDETSQPDLFSQYIQSQRILDNFQEHQQRNSIYYGNFLLNFSQLILIILENNLFKSLVYYIQQENVLWHVRDKEAERNLLARKELQEQKREKLKLKLEQLQQFSDEEEPPETTYKKHISTKQMRKRAIKEDIKQLKQFFQGSKQETYVEVTEQTLQNNLRVFKYNDQIRWKLSKISEIKLKEHTIKYVERAFIIFQNLLPKTDSSNLSQDRPRSTKSAQSAIFPSSPQVIWGEHIESDQYDYSKNNLFFNCNLLLGNLYTAQKQLVMASNYYKQAEICLEEICPDHNHLNFAKLYYRMGLMDEIEDDIMVENICMIMILPFDIIQLEHRELIIKQLMTKSNNKKQENNIILKKILDNFRQVGIKDFFHRYLKKYCESDYFKAQYSEYQKRCSGIKKMEFKIDEKEQEMMKTYQDSQDMEHKRLLMSVSELIQNFDIVVFNINDILYIIQRCKKEIQVQQEQDNKEDEINNQQENYFRKAFWICQTVWEKKKTNKKHKKDPKKPKIKKNEPKEQINELYSQIQKKFYKTQVLFDEKDTKFKFSKIIQELKLSYNKI